MTSDTTSSRSPRPAGMRAGAREASAMWCGGVWAIVYGVNEIFAAFTLREAGKQPKRAAD